MHLTRGGPVAAAPEATPTRMPILPILRAARAEPPRGWPLLRLGFRPFYLGAALFAAAAVPLWVAVWLGGIAAPMALPPLWWHAHEMLFGFAAAVIVGFLLTAGKAWTGLPTPRGTAAVRVFDADATTRTGTRREPSGTVPLEGA